MGAPHKPPPPSDDGMYSKAAPLWPLVVLSVITFILLAALMGIGLFEEMQ